MVTVTKQWNWYIFFFNVTYKKVQLMNCFSPILAMFSVVIKSVPCKPCALLWKLKLV